jgi:hypothetical protein
MTDQRHPEDAGWWIAGCALCDVQSSALRTSAACDEWSKEHAEVTHPEDIINALKATSCHHSGPLGEDIRQ